MVQKFSAMIIAIVFSSAANAAVLFEGYSKVLSGGVHIGYTIARYEFDAKKKQFTATTFLKTNQLGGEITESIKAVAGDNFAPISYSYTLLSGKTTKVIDATFSGNNYSASIKEGSKVEKISKKLPKGTFLSSFLAYVMLKSPKGLMADTKYDYSAIAEEDGSVEKGVAVVKNIETVNGIKAFRVLNEFKNAKFISFLSDKGEVLSTKNPVQSIATEAVAQPGMATSGFQIPSALLKTLFGDVPLGVENQIAKNYQSSGPKGHTPPQMAQEPVVENPGKQQGIPQGKDVLIKGKNDTKDATAAEPQKE